MERTVWLLVGIAIAVVTVLVLSVMLQVNSSTVTSFFGSLFSGGLIYG